MEPSFEVLAQDSLSSARTGRLRLARDSVATPCFMPVGTQGTVKAMLPWQVREAGYDLILANTYHLALRPGVEVIEAHGGLQAFMGWDGAILTDSGGFQVYSLAPLRRVSEEGVLFRSHVDGKEHFFTPEWVVQAQERMGSDIAMVLDVCPPSTAPRSEIEEAVRITSLWARRSMEARTKYAMALFGIVQGGVDPDLRKEHARFVASLPFDGIAIGGLSVGEPRAVMHEIARVTCEALPTDRPRYLMGVGTPTDILACVLAGVDLFDCVFPTRAARNGLLFTWNGRMNIRNAKYEQDLSPIDPDCPCPTCRRFTRSFLRHMSKAGEITSSVLNTIHNMYFMSELMKRVRQAIEGGTLSELVNRIFAAYPLDGEAASPPEGANLENDASRP